MKEVIDTLLKVHTNMTILDTMLTTMRDGYTGSHKAERSESFERKITALIAAEQQRLLGVMDSHKAKAMKAMQTKLRKTND